MCKDLEVDNEKQTTYRTWARFGLPGMNLALVFFLVFPYLIENKAVARMVIENKRVAGTNMFCASAADELRPLVWILYPTIPIVTGCWN